MQIQNIVYIRSLMKVFIVRGYILQYPMILLANT